MATCIPLLYLTMAILLLCLRSNAEYSVPKIQAVKELSENILRNYSKHILPSEKLPFNVFVEIIHRNIGNIDEIDERLSDVFWLNYMWKDEIISWNENETNITWLTLSWKDVWTPIFRIANPHTEIAKAQNVDRTYDTVIYRSDGTAYFSELMTTRTTCDLDMTYYPFDIQACSIELFIVGHTKYPFNIKALLNENADHGDQNHGSWTLINETVEASYGTLTITFVFQRKPMFLLINIFLPIIILALLTPVVFILPKGSGERVGYSITMLLAISVYMVIVSDHLPQNSQPMPLISIMIFICYILDAFIVFVVIINTKIKAMKDRGRLPYLCRKFVQLTSKISACLNCEKPNNKYDEHSEEDGDKKFGSVTLLEQEMNYTNNESAIAYKKSNETVDITWKDLSNAIDTWCFVITYAIKILLPVIFLSVCNTQSRK